MAEASPSGLPGDAEEALDRYFAEEDPGEVNDYLDNLGISHPRMRYMQLSPDEQEFHLDYAVVPCDPGTHPVARYDKYDNGRLVWYCIPD
jgi:hypothetical protein